jgi:hypothetical protein
MLNNKNKIYNIFNHKNKSCICNDNKLKIRTIKILWNNTLLNKINKNNSTILFNKRNNNDIKLLKINRFN